VNLVSLSDLGISFGEQMSLIRLLTEIIGEGLPAGSMEYPKPAPSFKKKKKRQLPLTMDNEL
jgi:hypothetical protein